MSKKLSDFSQEDLVTFLGLGEYNTDTLDVDGVEMTWQEADKMLKKLRDEVRFSDIRGHIAVEGLANISYSEHRTGDRFFDYDYYEKTARSGGATFRIDKSNSVKVFVSSANWIDFFFDTNDIRITLVLVP